jgi:Transcriptional regulator
MDNENNEKQVSGVVRAITILEKLSDVDSINLESLSRSTGIPKATLIRFLQSLMNLGYVSRDDSDRYSLTLKMFATGSKALKHTDLIQIVRPYAKTLCNDFGETVHMGIKDGEHAIYVLKEESSYTLRMYSRIGKVIPLYCTAIGKVFLSEMSEEEVDEYISTHPLKPFTPNSLRTGEALKQEIALIKERGWSIDNEEHEENVICLALPIYNYEGEAVAALSVSWPIFRFEKSEQPKYIAKIKNCTQTISRILGYEG